MSEDTNLQKLFGGGEGAMASSRFVVPTPPLPPPATIPTLDIFEGLGYNRATGEAFAIWHELNEDGMPTEKIRKTVGTGWFFEDARQQLPTFSGAEVVGTASVAIAPWNFPTTFSIAKLINVLKAHGAVVDGFEYDDLNTQFPYTARAARILLDFGGKRAKLAAGQLIRGICAHTAEDGTQYVTAPVMDELAELQRQLTTE